MPGTDLLSRVLAYARENEHVRAVTMEGSRADPDALHDRYSDCDVTFFTDDIRLFTNDRAWLRVFGDPVIMQCTEDQYDEDYDYESREPYIYMMQFEDGSRVDLNLRDLSQIGREAAFREPRRVLLDKDGYAQLKNIGDSSVYHVKKPSKKEYRCVCNEFRWVSVYVSKGLCRRQLPYAKHCFDELCMRQLVTMLSWRAAAPRDFAVSVGANGKYLEKWLPADVFARYAAALPGGSYPEIWDKLFLMYDLFAESARFVAEACGYAFDGAESARVRAFLEKRRREQDDPA